MFDGEFRSGATAVAAQVIPLEDQTAQSVPLTKTFYN